MASKPTEGFASRTEAVLALRAASFNTREIAARLGIETKTVNALEVSALRSARRRNLPIAEQGRAFLVPMDVLSKMRRPAAARGISANDLARVIVEAVVKGNLINAVLDDDVAEDIGHGD